MKYLHNDHPLPNGSSFTIGDERFGSNWLSNATPEMLTERGITIAPSVPPRPAESEKFYYITLDGNSWTVTPKNLDGLKRMVVAEAQRVAEGMLDGSDWMLVRNFETGEPVLTEWTEYRAAIRAESNRIEVVSVAATTVVALEAIKNNWPRNPDELAEEARRAAEVEAAKLEAGGE